MGVTPKKEAVVAEIQNWLTTSQGIVVTSYKGLNVATDTQMRRELREAGVTYKVVKNTMLRIAAKNVGIEGLETHLEGTTAIAFSATGHHYDILLLFQVRCFPELNTLYRPSAFH